LTGYDNRDTVSGKPDQEVFLYDATRGQLVCASCNPTGERPHGVAYGKIDLASGGLAGGDQLWKESQWIAANVPGWTAFRTGSVRYQSRYLSNSGRLFFNSSDSLVGQDVNAIEDVYEYNPQGLTSADGSACNAASVNFSEASDGCVGLISSGTSAEESAFLDASESGGDVFFLSSERLASQDKDTSLDVYDARECTAPAPCIGQAASPPACQTADACRAGPSPQPPILSAPPSATFSGVGNLSAPLTTPPSGKPKPPTRRQKLVKALKACHLKKNKRKRSACEASARAKYGEKKAKKRKAMSR
jgi:hypothetical protein